MYKVSVPCNLSLFEREMYIKQIKEEIKRRERFLLEKRKNLNYLIKDNEILKDIKNDYDNYYNFILREKIKQKQAMTNIYNHIKNIIIEGKLTKNEIEEAKKEKIKILRELKNIKINLENLINKI